MPVRIALIAEADADRRHVCELVDRKIRDHAPDWWDDRQIEVERMFCGLTPSSTFTRWRELKDLPSPEGALRRGGLIGFGAKLPRHFDYALGRKALLSSVLAKPRVDAVILIRDMDQQADERTASLKQARDEIPHDVLRVVLAIPKAKREAWSLNGFEPQDKGEEASLDAIRREFNFDPLAEAEKLTAMTPGAKRDAKRVLVRLMGHSHEREAICWQQTSLAVLRSRGVGSGLAQFLSDVKQALVPLVIGRKP